MWNVIRLEKTRSTNSDALSGKPWDVFTAKSQTAGRGRLDHKWIAKPGANLAMSAVLDVSGLEPAHVATLPLAVGLAVVEALSRFAPGLRLKWPNDIIEMREGRKLSGILCERSADKVIAGIGVNVREQAFPPEIATRAVSLAMLGADAGTDEVLNAVLSSLSSIYKEWKDGGFAAIKPRLDAVDALRGVNVEVWKTDSDPEPVHGICGGIASDGALIVDTNRIYAGEARKTRAKAV